ncbi:Hypothetical protein CINCED_3A022905 [Cinara cedri]|uniref:Uncharacterized protein n=1 Tax=Cinara cedri TaxID=506608 RepID=A0A5E4M009_9HEMI|nr:Hypothetical protein CINCED_3A022905 [Cinara cedri]
MFFRLYILVIIHFYFKPQDIILNDSRFLENIVEDNILNYPVHLVESDDQRTVQSTSQIPIVIEVPAAFETLPSFPPPSQQVQLHNRRNSRRRRSTGNSNIPVRTVNRSSIRKK